MPRTITYAQAINEAMAEEMERDDRVFLMGQDVGAFGGIYGVSAGLHSRFGGERVIDTPISEMLLVGAGVGAELGGVQVEQQVGGAVDDGWRLVEAGRDVDHAEEAQPGAYAAMPRVHRLAIHHRAAAHDASEAERLAFLHRRVRHAAMAERAVEPHPAHALAGALPHDLHRRFGRGDDHHAVDGAGDRRQVGIGAHAFHVRRPRIDRHDLEAGAADFCGKLAKAAHRHAPPMEEDAL